MPAIQPRIAIIGGGPAGLTLGVLLHKLSIPFTIFERRQRPTDQELAGPSGMLDLHDESGIAAIKECGLYEEFLKHTGECSESQKISDKGGNIVHEDDGGPRGRPEISRYALYHLLLPHISTSSIHWGRKVTSVTSTKESGQGEVTVSFEAHAQEVFDLVIGADGAWSKVRQHLTSVKPEYSGVQNLTVCIRQATTKYPHLSDFVGLGSFSALGGRHGVITQRGPQNSIRVYVILTTDDENFVASTGLAGQTASVVKERILTDRALLGSWGSIMKELVGTACDEETADNPGAAADFRPIYRLPVGHSWKHKPGATLVGDAAHLMGPWAGEGVNLAMRDSLLLSRAIAEAYQAAESDHTSFQAVFDPLLERFEADMVAHAKEKAVETLSNGQMLFGDDDAAMKFAQFFKHMGE